MSKVDAGKIANQIVTRAINALPEKYRKSIPQGWRVMIKSEIAEELLKAAKN